jgi:RNA polymerase sigma factor (TIGR02999 family)
MSQPAPNEISELLVAWGGGDELALDRLMPLVYGELRRLANRYMSQERHDLVNQAYLRLVNWRDARWQNRAHFFRRFGADDAAHPGGLRARQTSLEAGRRPAASLTEPGVGFHHRAGADLVALDEALTALAEVDHRKSQFVEMRFFGGLSVKEVAEVLKVSEETVLRDWRLAKVWLLRELDKTVTSGFASKVTNSPKPGA